MWRLTGGVCHELFMDNTSRDGLIYESYGMYILQLMVGSLICLSHRSV